MKPGYKTTEFWVTAVLNIVGSIVTILVARGMLSEQEGYLWTGLAKAIIVVVVPIILAYVNGKYIDSRTAVKGANGVR